MRGWITAKPASGEHEKLRNCSVKIRTEVKIRTQTENLLSLFIKPASSIRIDFQIAGFTLWRFAEILVQECKIDYKENT